MILLDDLPVQIERFAFPIMGRIVLEGLCPMLELSMIVSLTYDRRRSWTARFCNTRPIKLLGNISMSFYMTHMLAYMLFTAVSCYSTTAQTTSSPCA